MKKTTWILLLCFFGATSCAHWKAGSGSGQPASKPGQKDLVVVSRGKLIYLLKTMSRCKHALQLCDKKVIHILKKAEVQCISQVETLKVKLVSCRSKVKLLANPPFDWSPVIIAGASSLFFGGVIGFLVGLNNKAVK